MNREELAEGMFSRFQLGTDPRHLPTEVDAIEEALRGCTSQQQAMTRIAELLSDSQTPRGRYLRAKALSWAGAKHRRAAINAWVTYLSGDIDREQVAGGHLVYGVVRATPEQEWNIHLAEAYRALGEAYEGEYEFEYALRTYQQQAQLTPFWPAPYVKTAQVLVKMNKLDEALEVLHAAQNTDYYPPHKWVHPIDRTLEEDTSFAEVIDRYVADVEGKLARGYVYRARPRK